MTINRVDVDKFKETVEKAKKEGGKKTVEMEGEWRLGKDGPQFESKIKTEMGGDIIIQSDETIILGGGGTAPNPVQYCIYGLIACYAATFAKWAAMEGIVLKKFRIKAQANLDLTKSFGLSENPILESLKWEMTVDSDADMEKLEKINQIAKERCPGYYYVTHAIFPEVKIRKEK